MWSSPQFRTEPVPASAFRALPGAEVESWAKVRAGREVFAAAQCIRCHAPRGRLPGDAMPELSELPPNFDNIGARLEAGWLEKWIASPQGRCPSLATAQAADVAAHLASLKETTWKAATVPSDAKSIAEGAALAEKLNVTFWIEPLTKERKHTDCGLVEQLLQPALHHPDTIFPDVRLSPAEAAQIAAYIRSKQPARLAAGASGNAEAGKAIVAATCVACHAPQPGTTIAAALPLEEMARRDWTVKGCVAENRGSAPNLRLAREEVALLVALRNADRDVGMASLRRFAPAEYAASQMKKLNCAQCHSKTVWAAMT